MTHPSLTMSARARSTSWLVSVLVATVAGCATTGTHPQGEGQGAHALAFFGPDGAPIGGQQALGKLSAPAVRHVYVGERHGDGAFHRAQLAIVAALRARGPVVVGVEWLGRDKQALMDGYLAGRSEWAAFDAAAGMTKRWGKKAAASHRSVLRFCRANEIPVVALNAPDGLARKVAQGGPGGVPSSLRQWLPPLDTANPAHKAYFTELMTRAGGHGGGHKLTPGMLDRYYRAQLVWDESMALATHGAMLRYVDHTVIVLAGLGHVEFGHGIPLRVQAVSGPAVEFRIVRPLGAAEQPPVAGKGDYPSRIADLFVRAAAGSPVGSEVDPE